MGQAVVSGKPGSPAARWLPASGIAFVVLAVLSIVVFGGDTPDDNASAARVASYYNAHQNREVVAAFVLAASVPFLAAFGVYLATIFPNRHAQRSVGNYLLLVGTAVASAVWLVTSLLVFALADGADRLSASTLQGLNLLDADSWIAFNAGLGVFMLGAGATLIPATGGYRRLGWAAGGLGVLLFIPFADFIALLLTGIWILVSQRHAHPQQPRGRASGRPANDAGLAPRAESLRPGL